MTPAVAVILWVWFILFIAEALDGFEATRNLIGVYPRLCRRIRRR